MHTLVAMTMHPIAATGPNTDNGTPRGYSTITPFLVLQDPAAALDFYQEVFGARLASCNKYEGVVVHAEIEFAHGRLQLGAASPDYETVAVDPQADQTSYSLAFYCAAVDDVVERAIAHGATLREPVETFVSGDRFGGVKDPFGVRWTIMTRVEDLTDAESEARVNEWLAQQG